MKHPLKELRGSEHGDIWVVASGASMDYVDPSFFKDKTVVGVNDVYKKFPCQYLVRKDIGDINLASGSIEYCDRTGAKLIVSEYEGGRLTAKKNELDTDYYYFPHLNNQSALIDTSVVGTDTIVVSRSTITSAIHIAYYLGAENIIICGHDCGSLDGVSVMSGYKDPQVFGLEFDEWFKGWVKTIEQQTLALKQVIPVPIYSLNPFINFGLEGHTYA